MWIKPVIVILLIALLTSLASGLIFLVKDKGRTRRTLHSLGIRVTLAVTLVAVIAYGFYSGQLHSKAPWDAAMGAAKNPVPGK
jgi:hypothetical protein